MVATEQEVWKDIANYPGYQVSDNGRVRSCFTGRWKILKPGDHNHGYHFVNLYKNKKPSAVTVHKLVLTAFRGDGNGRICRHRNGNKKDNRLCNLRWGTHRQNTDDSKLHGTFPMGETSTSSKLTESQVVDIITRYAKGGVLQRELAAEYGVSIAAVGLIVRRVNWKHVVVESDIETLDWPCLAAD